MHIVTMYIQDVHTIVLLHRSLKALDAKYAH